MRLADRAQAGPHDQQARSRTDSAGEDSRPPAIPPPRETILSALQARVSAPPLVPRLAAQDLPLTAPRARSTTHRISLMGGCAGAVSGRFPSMRTGTRPAVRMIVCGVLMAPVAGLPIRLTLFDDGSSGSGRRPVANSSLNRRAARFSGRRPAMPRTVHARWRDAAEKRPWRSPIPGSARPTSQGATATPRGGTGRPAVKINERAPSPLPSVVAAFPARDLARSTRGRDRQLPVTAFATAACTCSSAKGNTMVVAFWAPMVRSVSR